MFDDLVARGLVHNSTDNDALLALLDKPGVVFYLGIDPTASSLHIGHLLGVIAMRRLQEAGHKPLALVGGATGMVGDPSGRSDERNLLDSETLNANVAAIKNQLKRFLDFDGPSAAHLVNNYDWTKDVTVLDFLRDIGKHVTVNQMVAKDSIRSRMESEHGISYTEFSYMLLQAFDYWFQHETYGCQLQIGGSDQWGNITAGIDLVRRRSGAVVHGLTWPLMTRADGAKFGKTAQGAIWLDPEMTLPYELHQYFLNVDDADVRSYLLQLTLLPINEIDAIITQHESAPHERIAQNHLADATCTLIHGEAATSAARTAADILFRGADVTPTGIEALRGIVAETQLTPDQAAEITSSKTEPVVVALLAAGMCQSKGEARKLIAGGGVKIDGQPITDPAQALPLPQALPFLGNHPILIQKGKKTHHLLTFPT